MRTALDYARELYNKFEVPEYSHADENWFNETKTVCLKVLDELMAETNNIGFYLEVKRELENVIQEKIKEGPGY